MWGVLHVLRKPEEGKEGSQGRLPGVGESSSSNVPKILKAERSLLFFK